MKSFKEYLMESKKVYEFKVKVAGELSSDASKKIKLALDKYKVESCSSGKRSPIQESPADFPGVKNASVTVFDICLAYPTNSPTVQSAIAEGLGCSTGNVFVLTQQEEDEFALNHEHDNASGESLLGKDYEVNNEGQKLVGEKQKMSLLKELGKTQHDLKQYTGVNDQLLAKSVPKGSKAEKSVKENDYSTIGGRKVKLPTAKGL